jgi:hypothetical protein
VANIYGRQVVLPLTNKSGGGVVAGDVVIIDTSNDGAFTTTTSGQSQLSVGIAQETIANNATGRVLVAGYAALVNVPSSMTRGRYLETHTVAKQATQNTTRRAGSFGQYLTGGTTPTAWLWGFPDNAGAAGSTVSNDAIWTVRGQVAVATGSGTAAAIERPELDDFSSSGGSNVTFTSPTSDNAALTVAAETGMAQKIISTEVTTRRHAYVASAIGTGDFDLRCRITDLTITIPHTTTSAPIGAFFVADSSLTASTRLSIQIDPVGTTTAVNNYALAVVGTSGSGQQNFGIRMPIILRIKRVGTTVTFYCSTTEGRNWTLLSTVTSSLNIGRIGVILNGGSVGTQTSEMLVHWIRSF